MAARAGAGPPQGDEDAATSVVSLESSKECGCGQCRPACLQPCLKPSVYLLCVSTLVFTQSMLVSGYISGILTTIEKNYDLWSSESGLILSSYDFTSLFAVMFVSYFGDQYNRATWLGRGSVIIAVGSIIFALPHFFSEPYLPSASSEDAEETAMCSSSEVGEGDEDCDKNPLRWAMVLFVLAQMITGIGAAPVYTLGPTYLYDNVKPSRYSIYASIMYSMSALGPAMGFLLSAFLLGYYVDIDKSDVDFDKYKDLNSESASWVGAWWLGLLVCGALALLVAVPLLLFPTSIPGKQRNHHSDNRPPSDMAFVKNFKEFPYQAKRLFTNMTWLFITIAFVVEQALTAGFIAFIAKYLQVSFGFSASKANILTGAVIIPGACSGILVGGYIMKRLELDVAGIAKFLFAMDFIPTLALASLFFFDCQTVKLAGVTAPYAGNSSSSLWKVAPALTTDCNSGCSCNDQVYKPFCGPDQLSYYNPCYAGCHTDYSSQNCSCVDLPSNISSIVLEPGTCESGCEDIAAFLVVLFIVVFITSCGHNPVLIITLRSCDQRHKSFALGIQNCLARLLAFIPTPIYFGQIFDSQCLQRMITCGRDGTCLEYDVERLPYVLFGTCLGLKGLALVALFLTYLVSRKGQALSAGNLGGADSGSAAPPGPVLTVSATFNTHHHTEGQARAPQESHANGHLNGSFSSNTLSTTCSSLAIQSEVTKF